MTSTFITYYVETNLICMLFIAFVFYTYFRESRGLAESKWFLATLLTIEVYCVSDILAALFKNQPGIPARIILWAANTIYIVIPLILVFFWNYYVIEHFRSYYNPGKMLQIIDKVIPILSVAIAIIAITTPVTHTLFYLDELNGYHRAIGAYLVPVYAYIFLIYTTIRALIIGKHCDSLPLKQDANILSLFSIPCVLFSLIQVVLYGTTISQVGFTMAILMVFLGRQGNKISRDELTGLNNRREYEYAIDRLTQGSGSVMIAMIDVNHFKSINDTYGHLEGDYALKEVAKILRAACSDREKMGNIALFRYGGDEFAMISADSNVSDIKGLLFDAIQSASDKWNEEHDKPYKLELSVGIVCGSYSGKNILKLVEAADQEMYAEKIKHKAGR